jgi:endogenous inhibitor of DNA gyrase (YacG/DUF329 family)
MNNGDVWTPRCPKCGKGTPVLAPANDLTKHLLLYIEVYCPECQWQDKLQDNIKKIYVRM